MITRLITVVILSALLIFTLSTIHEVTAQNQPPNVDVKVVDPGPPPSDAIVLFDGIDLSQWMSAKSGEAGNVTKEATVTVLHNGVLIQDNVTILGTISHDKPPAYSKHQPKESLALQDHGNPVRYRNIWVRLLDQ